MRTEEKLQKQCWQETYARNHVTANLEETMISIEGPKAASTMMVRFKLHVKVSGLIEVGA